MPGMQQVEAAAGEDNALPVVFPFAPLENQAVLRDHLSQFAALLQFAQLVKNQFYHAPRHGRRTLDEVLGKDSRSCRHLYARDGRFLSSAGFLAEAKRGGRRG